MTQFDFVLDKEKRISITVPDVASKFNYYYEPTEKLHQFDEATVTFISKAKSKEIYEDMIDEILFRFYGTLNRVLYNKIVTPSMVKPGNMGYLLNTLPDEEWDDELSIFWVWSSPKDIQTFIYKINDIIYLEIAPTYPWHYIEPKPGDNYIPFEEFMKSYKPYAVEVIPQPIALEWMNKCEEIIKLIGVESLLRECNPEN
jgi:hypothetical protein